MKKNVLITVFAGALWLLITLSCSRNNEMINSPAYKIAESEKLILPAEIDLPAGNSRVSTFYAEGIQKYKAQLKAGSNPAVYEWSFVAPEADLYDASNNKTGTHGAGPFWTLTATDSIFAQSFSPPRAATPDAGSIPWLQLQLKEGTIGTGVFSSTIYIQRIATTGGKAPATAPQSLADQANVFYTAVYRFSRKN